MAMDGQNSGDAKSHGRVVVGKEDFGPWLIVQRQKRRSTHHLFGAKEAMMKGGGKGMGDNLNSKNGMKDSRFEALINEEEMEIDLR